jgi:hypothetical protein
MPDIEMLRSFLDYNPETGIFTWRKAIGRGISRAMAGDVAGFKNWYGYTLICINRKRYRAHRLAYEFINGPIDEHFEIDHINGIREDNRITNLRLATRQQNSANSRIANTNKSGMKGVHRHSNGRHWVAQIMVGQKGIHLGLFKSAEAAHSAYITAAKKYFGEFARAE